jgi:hypothetical protein
MRKKTQTKPTGKRYQSVADLPCSVLPQPMNVAGKCSSTSGQKLPLIKIKKIKDVAYSQMDLEMEDEAFDVLAEYGRKIATDKDFFQIGFLAALKASLPFMEKRKK